MRPSAPKVVLGLLCAMSVILCVDRVNISTAAPLIKAELKLTNTQLGVAFSAFAFPYALFQLVGGWISDRFGARITLVLSCAIVAAATVFTGAVTGFATLLFARLVLGFGEGAAFTAASRALANWTPEVRWGFAQGMTHGFARLGNALTPLLIATLIGWASWRISFVIVGLESLPWLCVWDGIFVTIPGNMWELLRPSFPN
jgi:MFS family permease